MSLINHKNRIFGLDVIRAFAIIAVLIGHTIQCFSIPSTTLDKAGYIFGYYGVELFFVLSGFLIGQILFKQFSNHINLKGVVIFWKRRWLRTLPLYYVILILHIILGTDKLHLSHFVFLQNMNMQELQFFPVSWSLSVEEWFYIITPIYSYIIFKISSSNNFRLFSLLLFIAILIIIRLKYTLDISPQFDWQIRKNTFLRLDSIMIGVIMAFIKLNFSNIFKFICSKVSLIFVLFIFVLSIYLGNILIYDGIGIKTISFSFGLTLNSIILAFIVIYFDQNSYINNLSIKSLKKSVLFISLTSYSIYLIHYPILHLIVNSDNSLSSIMQVFISVSLILLISYFTFKFIETPFLKFRNNNIKHD